MAKPRPPKGRAASTLPLYMLLLGGCALAIGSACLLGSADLPPSRVFAALLMQGLPGDQVVLWEIRLPRAMAGFVTGAALGVSGAGLQGLLRNPLAEPGVLGVTASSALCATFAIYYGLIAVSPFILPCCAIVGALAASSVLAIAALRSTSVVTLILTGVGLSSFSTAMMALLMNLAPNPFSLADMVGWMLGSVANRSVDDLRLCLPFILLGCLILLRSGNGLSALTLGEEGAAGLGLNVRRTRLLVVAGVPRSIRTPPSAGEMSLALSVPCPLGFLLVLVPPRASGAIVPRLPTLPTSQSGRWGTLSKEGNAVLEARVLVNADDRTRENTAEQQKMLIQKGGRVLCFPVQRYKGRDSKP